jgi:hypothetical protein
VKPKHTTSNPTLGRNLPTHTQIGLPALQESGWVEIKTGERRGSVEEESLVPVEAERIPDACRGGEVRRVLKKPVRTTVTGLGGLEEEGWGIKQKTGEDGETRAEG